MSMKDVKKIMEYQANLEAMRTMVVVMSGDKAYTVQRDDRLQTASCNVHDKKIMMTTQLIPKGLPQWKAERLLDGVCAHEGGHIVVTAPYAEAKERWIKMQKYPFLAQHVDNILEDLRVNFYVENRYRFDFGQRLIAFHETVTPSMVEYATKLPLAKKRLEKCVVILDILTLGGIDLTNHLDSAAAESVHKADVILRAAKFKKVTRDLIKAADDAYKEMEKLVVRPAKSKRPKIRVDMDIGKQKLSGDQSGPEEEEDTEPLTDVIEAALNELEAL